MIKKLLAFLKAPYRCDNCGPHGWSSALFVGFDGWRMKDGSFKWLCRRCSGYRSFF